MERGSTRAYLDSNVFVYARLDKKRRGKLARKLIELIETEKIKPTISALIIDEVVWAIKRFLDFREAIKYGKQVLALPNLKILTINEGIAISSFNFMEMGIRPHDAIHAATMTEHGIFTIVTEDQDFKRIKEIQSLSFKETLERFG